MTTTITRQDRTALVPTDIQSSIIMHVIYTTDRDSAITVFATHCVEDEDGLAFYIGPLLIADFSPEAYTGYEDVTWS